MDFWALSEDERVPRMAWIDECRREKDRRHLHEPVHSAAVGMSPFLSN